jgi:hypothetical protein
LRVTPYDTVIVQVTQSSHNTSIQPKNYQSHHYNR